MAVDAEGKLRMTSEQAATVGAELLRVDRASEGMRMVCVTVNFA